MLIGRAVRPARRRDPRRRFRNRLLIGMVGVALLPLIAFAGLAVVELDAVAKSTADATEAAILQHQQDQQVTALGLTADALDKEMASINASLLQLGSELAPNLTQARAATPLPAGLRQYPGAAYAGGSGDTSTLVVDGAPAPTDGRFAAASSVPQVLATIAEARRSFPEIDTLWVSDQKSGALRTYPGFDVPGALAAGRYDPAHPGLRGGRPVFASSQDLVTSAPASSWVDPAAPGHSSGGPFWTDPYPLLRTVAPGISAWVPLGDGRTAIGADVSISLLFSTALGGAPPLDPRSSAYTMVLSSSGDLIYPTDAASTDFAGTTVGAPLRLAAGPLSGGLRSVERTGQPANPPLATTIAGVTKDVFTQPVFTSRWVFARPVPLSELEPNLSSLTLGVNQGVHRLFPVTVLPVLVLLVVLAFIAATLLTRRMVLPVRALTDHAVLEERTRLAHEIHDTLAQQLTGIVLELEAADTMLARGSERARQSVDTARDLSRAALHEARRSVWNLRPAPLAATGLVAAIGNEVEAWEERTSIPARFRARSMPSHPSLAPTAEVALLRIAQEALTNVAKHSRAARADVELRSTGIELVLTVQDDGAGFDAAAGPPRPDCFGLDGMAERARIAGGQLTVVSSIGHGTTVVARVPLAEAASVADSA